MCGIPAGIMLAGSGLNDWRVPGNHKTQPGTSGTLKGHTMNRKEAIRQTELLRKLETHGFTEAEFDQLRRISMALHRWAERECNGEVEVDCEGKAYSVSQGGPWNNWKVTRWQTANREAGALRRLNKIMAQHPGWTYYHQGDPRGAALYLVEVDRLIPGIGLDSCYSSIGIRIY